MSGKKYSEATKLIDPQKEYNLSEAIDLVKKTNPAKFDATVEAHLRLGVDLSAPEQTVRGVVDFPHGTGKIKKVLVFAEGEKEKDAKAAGADWTGSDDLIKKIEDGWLDFEIAVATPEMMPRISKIAKILGTKGLMPNPKSGTVTPEIAKIVAAIKKGRAEFRMDALGIIHQAIGKVSFSQEQLEENLISLIKAVTAVKPATVKGQFLKSLSVTSTMGPGIKINLQSLKF